MQKLIKCMEVLNCVLIGALGRHHELFSFKSEEGIEYLSLHVEYVICVLVYICAFFHICTYHACVCKGVGGLVTHHLLVMWLQQVETRVGFTLQQWGLEHVCKLYTAGEDGPRSLPHPPSLGVFTLLA